MSRWGNPQERFWSKVAKRESGCWEWTGACSDTGYGCFYDGRAYSTHRYSWIMANGPIPKGLCVLHRCDNRPCLNPDHLFLGTKRENSRDMSEKGRTGVTDRAGEKHGESKLTDVAVREIRSSKEKGRSLAAKFGVSESAVSLVRRGKSWTHVK